ncbi:hypothetical protein [Gemmata sp.]|uniref:hypothetical protein n=1 Tax=Gemmata sp. TaxID=1914242 RepID=UPI003F6EE5B4
MSDGPDPNDSPRRKTSSLAWAFVILFAVVLVVDLFAVRGLGPPAVRTFPDVGPVRPTTAR